MPAKLKKGKGLCNPKSTISPVPPVEGDELFEAMFDPELSMNQNNYNARLELAKLKRATAKVVPMADVVSIGRGINNPWIAHVKAHAKKHNISYGTALKSAKSTY